MMEKIKQLEPKRKMAIGILFIILGLFALVTPFTPGSWLIFLGFQLLGWNFFISGKKKGTLNPPQ